jgi:flagellar protein FliS
MASTLPINAYQRTVQNTITPAELLLRLYEGAIKAVLLLEVAIREKDVPGRGEAAHRATAILGELASALEGQETAEWSSDLIVLYLFLIEEITVANITGEAERLPPIRKILNDLLEGWREAVRKMPRTPAATHSVAPGPLSDTGKRLSLKG